MSESYRTSALAERHRSLGSELEDWNGMGTAWTYSTNANDEHDAVRERVGMFDMSPLKKVIVTGPDAATVLDHVCSKDMTRIKPGSAAYLSVLTDKGTMADDAIVYCISAENWMIVHGSGDTMALLTASAEGHNVSFELNDDLHDLSVQGPQALDVLNKNCSLDLAPMKYFEHLECELFGNACRISRTGYSGERGYEVFVGADSVVNIWDKLVEAGVMPCSFTALDKVRIEAGLLFYGYDMTDAQTPWEVGLGFTVHKHKNDFRGKQAVLDAQGHENIRNVCLAVEHDDMLAGGEKLTLNGSEVGLVNSPCYSTRLNKSLALAHVSASTPPDAVLTVTGDGINTRATITALPIYDTDKSRTHA